jgi:ParB-like chromosome segregation protein Spo0J
MEIRKVHVKHINPAPYNPRIDLQPSDPEYHKLKRSIQEFGYVEPLVWNEYTGHLVGGHQRFKILVEEGYMEVECSVVDIPEDKEKALNIALNKISGDWDMPKLKDLLEELDTGDFDLELTGFDADEVEKLMTQYHQEQAEAPLEFDEFDEDIDTKHTCPKCGYEWS